MTDFKWYISPNTYVCSTDMGFAASHPDWCPKCDQINVMKDDLCTNCGWDNRVVTCPTCSREVRAPDLYKGGYCYLCMNDAQIENRRIDSAILEEQQEQERIHYDAKAIVVGEEVMLDVSQSLTGFADWVGADDGAYVKPHISIEQAEKLYKSLGRVLNNDRQEKKSV